MRKHRKDEAGEKLIIKDLEAEMVKVYDKVVFNEKTYSQAQGHFQWGLWKGYGLTRVGFVSQEGKAIFKQPLLLVSNLEIKGMLRNCLKIGKTGKRHLKRDNFVLQKQKKFLPNA
jgi:hypothetical protein